MLDCYAFDEWTFICTVLGIKEKFKAFHQCRRPFKKAAILLEPNCKKSFDMFYVVLKKTFVSSISLRSWLELFQSCKPWKGTGSLLTQVRKPSNGAFFNSTGNLKVKKKKNREKRRYQSR